MTSTFPRLIAHGLGCRGARIGLAVGLLAALVDLAAAVGTTVRAALDGKVVVIGNNPVLGNYILIRHQISYSTLYGHLSQVWVSRGATVTRGQRIGAVGNTGKSTGPHLHFEIRRRGVPINAWGLMTSRY